MSDAELIDAYLAWFERRSDHGCISAIIELMRESRAKRRFASQAAGNADLEEALRAVQGLSSMKPGWDGYRSPAIGRPAIEGALSLLGMLQGVSFPRPDVSPVPGGGVQIDWESGDKELELEFRSDGTLAYLATDSEGEREGTVPSEDPLELWKLLVWLCKLAAPAPPGGQGEPR